MYKEIVLKELMAEQDIDYQNFMINVLPGVDNIIGVKIPTLRKIAKTLSKSNWQEYLEEVICENDRYHEETLLQGIVITTAKMKLEKRLQFINAFIPKISNWAQCDIFCSSLKEAKKYPEPYLQLTATYCYANATYKLRFGIVMLLTYYTHYQYAPYALNILKHIKRDDYYVNMAVAWAISIFYIKHPQLTLPLIQNKTLDKFTHNKAIQKICESLRISKEEKDFIKTWKL